MIERISTNREPTNDERGEFSFLSDLELSEFNALTADDARFEHLEVKVRDLIRNDAEGIAVIKGLIAAQKIRDQAMVGNARLGLDLGVKYEALRDAYPVEILALNEARVHPELLQLPVSKIVAHFSSEGEQFFGSPESEILETANNTLPPSIPDSHSEIGLQIRAIKKMHGTLPPPLPEQPGKDEEK